MGIQGLLQSLRSVTDDVSIEEYSGLKVAVDAMCWLHRGVYTCSTELCLGQNTDKYIHYCMDMVNMLLTHGVTPVLVFDGANLPAKEGEDQQRHERREAARKSGLKMLDQGNQSGAYSAFAKAVDVTPEMIHRLIQALQAAKVEFMVAPYEADAQLAFLARTKLVDAVITEDSDTIPYGCTRVLFKLDKSGRGKEIRRKNLPSCEELSLVNWTDDMVRNLRPALVPRQGEALFQVLNMCILAGCDYLPSLKGVGIKRANRSVLRYRTPERILQMMEFEGLPVTKAYRNGFYRARFTFQHQVVYDPQTQKTVPLTPLPPNASLEAWTSVIGNVLDDSEARGIAEGFLHPVTKAPYSQALPREPSLPPTMALPKKHPLQKRKPTPPPQKNSILTYMHRSAGTRAQFKAPRATPPNTTAESKPRTEETTPLSAQQSPSTTPSNTASPYFTTPTDATLTSPPSCDESLTAAEDAKRSRKRRRITTPAHPIEQQPDEGSDLSSPEDLISPSRPSPDRSEALSRLSCSGLLSSRIGRLIGRTKPSHSRATAPTVKPLGPQMVSASARKETPLLDSLPDLKSFKYTPPPASSSSFKSRRRNKPLALSSSSDPVPFSAEKSSAGFQLKRPGAPGAGETSPNTPCLKLSFTEDEDFRTMKIKPVLF